MEHGRVVGYVYDSAAAQHVQCSRLHRLLALHVFVPLVCLQAEHVKAHVRTTVTSGPMRFWHFLRQWGCL